MIAFLDATGIFEDASPLTPSVPLSEKFLPTTATLFLTNRCNLRCVYCYASGGERPPITMPREITRKAVTSILRSTFHGGGEPTLAWNIMKRTVDYFRESAMIRGLTPLVHTATNGVIPQDNLNWIIENLTCANISLDGLPEIQNVQRPTATGGPSFDAVKATMCAMDAKKFSYGVRATVTKQSVTEMGKFTSYLADNFSCLQNRTVAKIDYCQNCFCKYHCAGDCLTRATDGVHLTNILDTARCRINQDLTQDQIIQNLTDVS
ncbi:MAG: radical SAM protein [Nitrospirae bacterium]|nr:radical SAM protein [Nitrospirota bacterium]